MDTKIPFAESQVTGSLVEIGDTESGRDCKCICPSCGQGVLAKQGAIKQWHFAHDRHSKVLPNKPCDVSFFSSCFKYLMEQINQVSLVGIFQPGYTVEEKRKSFSIKGLQQQVVAKGWISIKSVAINGRFDLFLETDKDPINIFFTYPGRPAPKPPFRFDEGALSINLQVLKDIYDSQSVNANFFKDLLICLFEEDDDCKEWLFHPDELTVREQLRIRLLTEYPEFERYQPPIVRTEICFYCNKQWIALPSVKKKCPQCKQLQPVIF